MQPSAIEARVRGEWLLRLVQGWLVVAVILVSVSPAVSTDLTFPGHYFGRTDLPVRQSLEALLSDVEAFEEVRHFSPSNRYRKASRPVDRLDVLYSKDGRERMTTCTGWLIASDKLVTNRH